ncbi:hypothetical protein PoB_000171000 [Plakobranchus ocellatus]|uniref:Uncharacterized protein n=1 Tax=Plakobranchus ocellatus TaxID=259542 RepID=A0AAV3XXS1_9GAST|nr:hypothetical protein PoB_000171000 [Plakobranchus ocellatus]
MLRDPRKARALAVGFEFESPAESLDHKTITATTIITTQLTQPHTTIAAMPPPLSLLPSLPPPSILSPHLHQHYYTISLPTLLLPPPPPPHYLQHTATTTTTTTTSIIIGTTVLENPP